MSLMMWIVPLGSVSTAESRAISAIAASTLGNRAARGRRSASSRSRAVGRSAVGLFMDDAKGTGLKKGI